MTHMYVPSETKIIETLKNDEHFNAQYQDAIPKEDNYLEDAHSNACDAYTTCCMQEEINCKRKL